MKKTIALTLSAAMVLALAGCGSSSSSTAETTAAATEAPQETTTEAAAPAETTAAAEATTEAAADAATGDPEGWSGNDYTLTWSEVNGEDYGATVGAHVFADKIAELSGGHINIDLYINGTFGNEAESMQGVQMGTLDVMRGNVGSLANYGAEYIATTGLPYVFTDMEQFEDVAKSQLGRDLLDSVDAEDCGYVALAWLVEGPRSMFITPDVYKKLGEPDEFTMDMMKGLKVRVPETDVMTKTMAALGASATPIAYAELYTSLQSGVVDAAENGVTSYMSNSFNEVAPYFITDAHTFGCGVILMNKDKWNSFNDTEKGWLMEAAQAASDACYEYNQKQEQDCFDSFEEKGIKLLPVTDIEKWQEACAPLYAEQTPEQQELIKRIQSKDY